MFKSKGIVTSDVSKLDLKARLEEQVQFLAEYAALDIPQHPGWLFLLSPVVKAYGVCPFLNVNDEECKKQRITWLENQQDKGELYYTTVKEFTDDVWLENVERDLENLKLTLKSHVETEMKSLDLPDEITHETLVENIRMRKEAKSQNKKVKDAWNQTLRILDYIMMKKGIDFSKYVQVIYGYVLRYKAPVASDIIIDAKFVAMYEKYMNTCSKLNNIKTNRERERTDAESHLFRLIKSQFKLDQSGRYFKKWPSLSDDKKAERIKSYTDWFMRQNNRSVAYSEGMKDWILEKLGSKDLRVMDVKWDSKLGIITHVNVVMNEDGTFELCARAPKALKNTKKSAKKKKDEWFKTDSEKLLLERIHRLLLFEIVKAQSLNKDNIVKTVIMNLHTRLVPGGQLLDYINHKYDDLLETIRNNPIS